MNPRWAARASATLLAATLIAPWGCARPETEVADTDRDAHDTTNTADTAGIDADGDSGAGGATDAQSDANAGFACTDAFAACAEPCVFDFRFVDTDRDGVAEARVAAHLVDGAIVSIVAVDLPDWARFSDGFAQYLDRVTRETWSLSTDGRTVFAGAPIVVPAGESFAIEMRVDDPAVESCAAGACGHVAVEVADCVGSTATLTIPLIR